MHRNTYSTMLKQHIPMMKKEDGVISSNRNIIHLSSIPTNPVVNVVVDVLAVEIAQGSSSIIVHVRGSKILIGNLVEEKSVHWLLEGASEINPAIPLMAFNIFGHLSVVDGACLKGCRILTESLGASSSSNRKFPLSTMSVRCQILQTEIPAGNPSAEVRT